MNWQRLFYWGGKEGIPPLARHFLTLFAQEMGVGVPAIGSKASLVLAEYDQVVVPVAKNPTNVAMSITVCATTRRLP